MTAEEQIKSLTEQLKQALEQLKQTTEQLQATQEELCQAKAQIAKLEKRGTPTPSFAKANRKKQSEEEKKPRKKREAQYFADLSIFLGLSLNSFLIFSL